MKWRGLPSLILMALVVGSMSCTTKPEWSASDLVELLGIKRWVVPMPKDDRYEWTIAIRDYKKPAPIKMKTDSWADPNKKAEVTLMPIGERSIYQFWLKQDEGTSSGRMRIDVCENPDDTSVRCNAGQFEITWCEPPEQTVDGKGYVLCDIRDTFEPHRHKQLVLYLIKYRLEDMNEDE
jgi:hypothetical protein